MGLLKAKLTADEILDMHITHRSCPLPAPDFHQEEISWLDFDFQILGQAGSVSSQLGLIWSLDA